jgi:galactose mutarotase-like enzyme
MNLRNCGFAMRTCASVSSVYLVGVVLAGGVAHCWAGETDKGLHVEYRVYGTIPGDQQIGLYTLANASCVEASVMTLGATLTTVKTPDRDGNVAVITLHKDSLDEYAKGHPLLGSVVGRFANRIAGARFTIDGVVYELAHRLMLNADHYLPCDNAKMPTGEIRSVKDTEMDFTSARTIGAQAEETDFGYYDHCYVLNQRPNDRLSLCARVVEPKSGRVMTVLTTQPGVQLYTGNRYGLCLEAQHYPNTPNESKFPSTLLRPGKVLHEVTIHQFSTVK